MSGGEESYSICNICGKRVKSNETNDSYPINYLDQKMIRDGCCNSCDKYVSMCRRFKNYFPVETKNLFDRVLSLDEVIDICNMFNSKIEKYRKKTANYNSIKNCEPINGQWILGEQLAKGAGSCVYAAKSCKTGEKAAVKVITVPEDFEVLKDELGFVDKEIYAFCISIVERNLKQYKLNKTLHSENIVQIKDISLVHREGECKWILFFIMDLLTPLNRYLVEKRLACDEFLRVIIDICRALEVCESNKIIHRDVKIENIFVSDDKKFLLGDFGCSVADNYEDKTIVGTGDYMAPEIIRTQKYDNRADIYSLGMVMYKLFNNMRIPFLPANGDVSIGELEVAKQKRIKGDELPKPQYADEGLCDIILTACAYNPDRRYKSAKDLRLAIEKYLNGGEKNVKKTKFVDRLFENLNDKKIVHKAYRELNVEMSATEKLSAIKYISIQFNGHYGKSICVEPQKIKFRNTFHPTIALETRNFPESYTTQIEKRITDMQFKKIIDEISAAGLFNIIVPYADKEIYPGAVYQTITVAYEDGTVYDYSTDGKPNLKFKRILRILSKYCDFPKITSAQRKKS